MARRRLIGKPGSKYHVISRFVERQFATGSHEEKEMFLQLMRRQAAFSGVEVLTYCIMGNHFHLLLHIPERPAEISEKEILRRLRKIWKPERVKALKETFKTWRKISVIGDELVEAKLARFRERMYSLPEFMKDLKQRYSKWFNFINERKGTLFEERYKSVLVEDGTALRMMAAYIELNPVRAGIVKDPADFNYSGYARACTNKANNANNANKANKVNNANNANQADRQRGIRTIMTDPRDPNNYDEHGTLCLLPWEIIEPRYRYWLFERGRETHHRDDRPKKRGFTADEFHAARRIAADHPDAVIPHLSLLEKSRTMTEGLLLGGKTFVEQTIDHLQSQIGLKFPQARPVVAADPSTDYHLCQLANFRVPPSPQTSNATERDRPTSAEIDT